MLVSILFYTVNCKHFLNIIIIKCTKSKIIGHAINAPEYRKIHCTVMNRTEEGSTYLRDLSSMDIHSVTLYYMIDIQTAIEVLTEYNN